MKYLDDLIDRFPLLDSQKPNLQQAIELMIRQFQNGNKMLVCGNGGSAADADHIAGELLKGFVKKRPLPQNLKDTFEKLDPVGGRDLADSLQCGFPVINLTTHTALHTAFANDADYTNVFAQLTVAYGKPGDILFAISTSGNSPNVLRAITAARATGLHTIGLTGRDGGQLSSCVDYKLVVPETETYRIQELHLPIYHMICLELEEAFFH